LLYDALGYVPPLRHQERHERELTDQLVGVVAHGPHELTARRRAGLRGRSGGDAGALEVLVGRAVVALGKRRPLARLALARRRVAAGDSALERAPPDLLLDEPDGGADALVHGPRDLRLDGDREVAADVLEERAIRLREVVRVGGEALHRALTCRQHLAAVLELGRPVDVGV